MLAFIIFTILALLLIELLIRINLKIIGICILGIIILALFASIDVGAYEYDPSEIVLIGKVVHHEAGNQSELGKRLVADTILNRVESNKFPNTVKDVINQPGQYCNPKEYPPDGTYKIVAEEIYMRTNSKVLYFKTRGYHSFAVPIVKEGNHYFSGRSE